jgi:hypothetical protein
MRKFLRYLFQYAILAAFAAFVYQTAFKRDTPPVHDRALWSQRDGFVAISYSGITLDDHGGLAVGKDTLRRHLEALSRAGYKTVTTRDVLDFYQANKPLPDKALYLMFEGGRKDSVLFSQPVLTKVGYNAALYLFADRLKGWNRFFVRDDEARKVADNPFWDVNAMGYHSGLINQTADGHYGYFLSEYLAAPDGRPAETPEAFDARVARDYQEASQAIDAATGKPPLGYVFIPANTLGVSLPEPLARPNEKALKENFALAFTRVGETYNPREADCRALTRMQVGPDWTADRLLLEIGARMPKSRFLDFAASVSQGLWQVGPGEIAAEGQRLTLANPAGKDGFARLRGSEGFENFRCEVKVDPSPDGASLIYLRYRDAGSFVRIQTTADRVLVQEKNGPSLNTIFQYVLPLDHTGPVAYDCCVKSNRLLLTVDGVNVSPYPIPLTAGTGRGSFALGSLGDQGGHVASFSDLRLATFPPRWVQAGQVADVPLAEARTLTAMVLPAASLTADPINDAAALVTIASNGVTAFLDLPDADAAKVGEIAKFVADAPASLVFAKLLHGFVLSLDRFPDPAVLARTMADLHARGLAVALRLGPAGKARLLAADAALAPDWLLFDLPPAEGEDDMTVLENRFDKSRMLFRAATPDDSTAVYYDVKG